MKLVGIADRSGQPWSEVLNMDDRTVMSFLALYEYQDEEAEKASKGKTNPKRGDDVQYSG